PARVHELLLPERTLAELFPGVERECVRVPVGEIVRPPDMVLTIVEWLALGGICRWIRPQRGVEIGTYTGSSTLTMAMNWPDAARIYTLDLDPSEREALFTQMAVRLPSFAVGEQFQNFAAAGLPQSRVHIVTGRFEDTLPHWKPFPISFLHLDC